MAAVSSPLKPRRPEGAGNGALKSTGVPADIIVSSASGVGEICIDRPAKKNALTTAMYSAMGEALDAFDGDDDVRVVTIRGGSDFTAGNDLADFLAASMSGDMHKVEVVMGFLERLRDFSKPLVAAVRGNAVGIGTTLLLHTDVVVAGTSARFRLPFAALGLVPEAGSSLLLPLTVGRSRAAWLLMTGDFFNAEQALAMGLVAKVVEDDKTDQAAHAIATSLARLPSMALRETKRLMREPIEQDVRRQMDAETAAFIQCMSSDEFRAAATSLLKR
jgi:enoyl-CoA hydratase/carnithine racemase